MDRQLAVWIAPGLVLVVLALGFAFGDFGRHLPEPGARRPLVPEGVELATPEPTAPVYVPPAPVPAEPADGEPADEEPAATPEPEPAPVEEEPAPVAEGLAPGADPGATGTLVGRIVLKGGAPAPLPPLVFGAEASAGCCETPMDTTDRSLVVDASGGVAWAVIEVKVKGAEADGAGGAVEMDQRCCRYEPHVVVVPKGGTIRYKNSDDVTHNVHTFSRKNRSGNDNIPAGSSLDKELPYDEVVEHKCDIHNWMKSYAYVAESPFTDVSGLDGSFEIAGLPPGEHSVTVWHESLKKGRAKAEVAAGGRAEITIELVR